MTLYELKEMLISLMVDLNYIRQKYGDTSIQVKNIRAAITECETKIKQKQNELRKNGDKPTQKLVE